MFHTLEIYINVNHDSAVLGRLIMSFNLIKIFLLFFTKKIQLQNYKGK